MRKLKKIPTFVIPLICLLIIFATTGCTQTHPKPVLKPATQKIIYPVNFVKNFTGNDETSKHYANSMKQRLVPKDYMDVYAEKNGDIVIVVTKKQLNKLIKENDDYIKHSLDEFHREEPEYKQEASADGREQTIWLDRNIHPLVESNIATTMPQCYGLNYYLKGGTGDWDMQITFRNCHTNQLIHQYMWSQGWDGYTTDIFGY